MSNIAYLAAKAIEGRNWSHLHPDEKALVAALEKSGHLKPSDNGFVGDAVEISLPPPPLSVLFRYDRERGMFEFSSAGFERLVSDARSLPSLPTIKSQSWRVLVGATECELHLALQLLTGTRHPWAGQEVTTTSDDGATPSGRGRIKYHRFDTDGQDLFLVNFEDAGSWEYHFRELRFRSELPEAKDVHYGEANL